VKIRSTFVSQAPVRVDVFGSLARAQLSYLDEMVAMALDSGVLVGLDLGSVTDVDVAAVRYLARGEGSRFRIRACPRILRNWIQCEKGSALVNRAEATTPFTAAFTARIG